MTQYPRKWQERSKADLSLILAKVAYQTQAPKLSPNSTPTSWADDMIGLETMSTKSVTPLGLTDRQSYALMFRASIN